MRPRTPWLLLLGLAAFLRVPYLNFPVQGDDAFYLAMAQHALVDPLHPNHFKLVAQGIDVDMRGFPKPPGNAWILAGALAAMGDVREPVLHAIYALFSLIALWAVWELALVFCSSPRWAVALFAAVPAFVINGNSLEADLPFLAFFLAAMAFLVRGVEDESRAALGLSAAASGVAALIEYKTIFLVPLAGLYVWRKRRGWLAAWAAVLAPAFVFVAWQAFERFATGAASAEVLSGYFQSRGLQSGSNKLRNALALTVHTGWMVSPLLTFATFMRLDWIVFAAVALASEWYDPSALFWLPLAIGAALVLRALRRPGDYLEAWIAGFYVFALIIFFAGSARYMLPAAAPLVFATVNRLSGRNRLLAAGFATQLLLSLALNHANFQHWSAYRAAVAEWRGTFAAQRTWVASDWGLRFYAERDGAIPMHKGQAARPGDAILASRIGGATEFSAGGGVAAPVAEWPVRPSLPLRLLAERSPSAYSTHVHGLRAFDIDTRPADTVTLSRIVERPATLSYLPMNAPEAAWQLASGVYALEQNSWRWTGPRVVALLARPAAAAPVEATFRLIEQSPARRATLSVDGRVVAEQTHPGPGLYTIRSPGPIAEAATVTLTFDRSFRPPGDERELAAILTGIGFSRK